MIKTLKKKMISQIWMKWKCWNNTWKKMKKLKNKN